MNVITYSCGHMLSSDGTTVMSRLNKYFKFDSVISVESNLNIERYGDIWKDDNLTLINYHKEVKNFIYRGVTLRDMPPLSREMIEKLSLDRCHLYSMHRDESLTYRELDREILNCFQYWNYVLDEYNIDLFICHGFPHAIYTYSLYALCKAKNIKVLYIARACVPGYTYVHDDIFAKFDRLETAYKKALALQTPLSFSEYMQKSYMEPMENDCYKWVSGNKEPGSGSMQAKERRDIISSLIHISRWGGYIKRLYKRLHRKADEKRVPKKTDKYYRKLSGPADYSQRYIYVPLQMQPESTTSPMGNVFVDLLLMVKILAYCVKDTDIQLYVKEHNAQTKVFRLSRSKLYDELRELPNVHLISKEESSFKLQEHCIVSATCSGTVVMESLFKYKPVLVFGTRIHNLSPSALVVSDAESCSAALDDVLNGRFNIGQKEKEAFLYAVEQECFRGSWFIRFSHLYGISQDEAAENAYAELKTRIEEIMRC